MHEIKKALIKEYYSRFGELMDLQQQQELKLNAHTDKIMKMCDAAKNAGAFGAKQMGAGGGGCMLAICPGKQQAVAKAIQDAGGRTWIFDVFKYQS